MLCLVSSYIFYGWWDWRFLSLILFSTCIDYFVAREMANKSRDKKRSLLTISLVTNLGVLGIFKYFNFFAGSFTELLAVFGISPSYTTLNIILPVGISFYTFQSMSYTIDVYRGKCGIEHSFLRFASYVALFPQLVAGPIVRARKLLPQLSVDHTFDIKRVITGLELIIWGFFLKLCVADRLGLIVDPPFDKPDSFGGAAHILANIGFSFQIYGDFCGYSIIAIGLGRIMGLDFGINFRRPYLARNFSDFWQRWHISLSSWLKEYLYFSLGGNRIGKLKTYRNLMLVMLLGGLWHGAAWTFVVWGGLHGLYLTIQHWYEHNVTRDKPAKENIILSALQIIMIFTLVTLTWVFFRAESVSDAILILDRIVTLDGFAQGLTHNLFATVIGLSMILMVITIDMFMESNTVRQRYNSSIALRVSGSLILLWLIAFLGVFQGSAFIYFQF